MKNIERPEAGGRDYKRTLTAMVSFAEQVREGEADVEHRIAPVDDLMIEEDEAFVVDEDVLGAVIAVDEGDAGGAGLIDQIVQE